MVDIPELSECYKRIFYEVVGPGSLDETALRAYCHGISAWTLDLIVNPLENTIANLHMCMSRYIMELYPDEVKMVEDAIENGSLDDLPKDDIPNEVLQFVQGGLIRFFNDSENFNTTGAVTGDSETGSRSDGEDSNLKFCSDCGDRGLNFVTYRDDDGNIQDECCFDCARKRHYAVLKEADDDGK